MPVYSRPCDIYQGYNFKKDKQTTVGYITAMKIDKVTLKADQTVQSPLDGKDLKVVAVLNNFTWQTGVTDALYLSGQLATENRQSVALLAYDDLAKVEVDYNFMVLEYDPVAQKYYKGCSVDADLKGLLEKNGQDLNLSVSDEVSPEVQSPLNYTFQIGIMPQPSAQTVTIATSVDGKVVKAWGLKVG
jgi:hypothetical protein